MTDDDGRRLASVSATLAAAVALGTALVVGWGSGVGASVVVVTFGAILVGEGARRFAAADDDRAPASVAVSVGALALGAGVGLGLPVAPVVALSLAVAALVAAIDAGPGFSWEGTAEIDRTLRRSGTVVAAGAVLAGLVHVGAFGGIAGSLFDVWTDGVAHSAYVGLVILCVELFVAVLGFGFVVPVLDTWTPRNYRKEVESLARISVTPGDVPVMGYIALGVATFLAGYSGIRGGFEAILGLLAPLGPLVAATLTSVAVHAVPVAAACLYLLVFVAELGRKLVVVWLDPIPPRSAARATGGAVVVVLTLAITGLPPVGEAIAAELTAETVAAFGVGTVALGGTVVAMVALWVTLAATLLCAESSVVPTDRAGFFLASALLFVGTVAAAFGGAVAPVVFVGVAGTVLVVDVGEYAADLGGVVAPETETRRAEVVHATASGLVALAAVCVALVAAYVVVPLAPRVRVGAVGPEWAPAVVLTLTLLSLIAVLRLFDVSGSGDR